jgi:DMSO reductase anchor subunit
MAVGLGLVTIGLLSSTFHLGHPERAWRALSQWRSSWLSREGVAAVATYVPAILYGLVWTGLADAPAAIAPVGILLAVMAMATVFTTAKIYASLKTIRAWHQPLTVPVYLTFALATGAAVLAATGALFGRFPAFMAIVTAVLLLAAAGVKLFYWRGIDTAPRTHTIEKATGLGRIGQAAQWEVPHTAHNYVQTEMGYAVARKHARKLRAVVFGLLLAAIIVILLAIAAPPLAILAALLALAAAILERWLFFAEAQHVVTLFYGQKTA